ncbi:uncharacterized protein LOC122388824 isoform X2 [Amphibalanus amphitrite]|uniref:uncharacterized protein LOC122388824 isoform X2 n=1 Tax=Amphibalanus amphitrite TaxID=1232801 RepID=UPI001C9274CD|nr:uncharacterized protein LOC122388824 isoform X2 [Amphibalanus amphitrite]
MPPDSRAKMTIEAAVLEPAGVNKLFVRMTSMPLFLHSSMCFTTSRARMSPTTTSSRGPRGCQLDSCDGGSVGCDLSLSSRSSWTDPWEEPLPLSADEDDPALSMLLVRSLVTPEAGSPVRHSSRRVRIRNALEGGASALSQVLRQIDNWEREELSTRSLDGQRGEDRRLMEMSKGEKDISSGSSKSREGVRELLSAKETASVSSFTTASAAEDQLENLPKYAKPHNSQEPATKVERRLSRQVLLLSDENRIESSNSSSSIVGEGSDRHALAADQTTPKRVSSKDCNGEQGSQGSECEELQKPVGAHRPHSDADNEDDVVDNWHFVQSFIRSGTMQPNRSQECPALIDMQEGKSNGLQTNDVTVWSRCDGGTDQLDKVSAPKQPQSLESSRKTEERRNTNAERISDNSTVSKEDHAESESLGLEEQQSGIGKEDAKQIKTGKSRNKHRRRKAAKRRTAVNGDEQNLSSRKADGIACSSVTDKRDTPKAVLEDPAAVPTQRRATVFGINVSTRNEVLQIYVPEESVDEVGVDAVEELDKETEQGAANLVAKKKQIAKQSVGKNTKTSEQHPTSLQLQQRLPKPRDDHVDGFQEEQIPALTRTPQVESTLLTTVSNENRCVLKNCSRETPYQPRLKKADAVPSLLSLANSACIASVLDKTASREKFGTPVLDQPQRAKDVLRLTQRSESSTDEPRSHSPVEADMSKVSPTADTKETIVILKAALKSKDHSERITAHALLLAIGEDVDPQEPSITERSTPASNAGSGLDLLSAASQLMPKLVNIENHDPVVISNGDMVTSQKSTDSGSTDSLTGEQTGNESGEGKDRKDESVEEQLAGKAATGRTV